MKLWGPELRDPGTGVPPASARVNPTLVCNSSEILWLETPRLSQSAVLHRMCGYKWTCGVVKQTQICAVKSAYFVSAEACFSATNAALNVRRKAMESRLRSSENSLKIPPGKRHQQTATFRLTGINLVSSSLFRAIASGIKRVVRTVSCCDRLTTLRLSGAAPESRPKVLCNAVRWNAVT